jgi:hypothetical protein
VLPRISSHAVIFRLQSRAPFEHQGTDRKPI